MPADQASDTRGRRRLGRYELITPLGRGGMATVYLARMHGTAGFHRLVAVKVLRDELLDDPQLVSMFLEEARLVARIRHRNVVEVYDVETIGGELVIIMRWVEGAALSALERALPLDEPLPLPLATRIMHDALLGLHAAHELETDDGQPAGLVHRDVSPPNILVASDGTVLLADFGIATAAGRLRSTGAHVIRGKLAYMSPEQLAGGALDRRTDVFAAGVVLWELLAGRRLFAAEDDDVVIRNVTEMSIPPPGAHRAGVPIALDEAVLCALERDPARRFASAAAFAAALEEACGSTMMDARDVGKLVKDKLAGAIERNRAATRRSPSDGAPEPSAVAEGAVTTVMPTLVARPARPKRKRKVVAWAVIVGAAMLVAVAVAVVALLSVTRGGVDANLVAEPEVEGSVATVATSAALPSAPSTRPSANAATEAAPTSQSSPLGARPPRSRALSPHRPAPRPSTTGAAPRPAGPFVPTEP